MTGQINVQFEKEVSVLNDKKIISAIEARDERVLAFVVQKYSKLAPPCLSGHKRP